MAEMARCGIILDYTSINLIDASVINTRTNPKDLASTYKKHTNEDLDNAHEAANDVMATLIVFQEQLKSTNIPNNVKDLHYYSKYDNKTAIDISGKFVTGKDGCAYFAFGKYNGLKAYDFKDYLEWMLTEGSAFFTTDVVSVASAILNRKIM